MCLEDHDPKRKKKETSIDQEANISDDSQNGEWGSDESKMKSSL